MNQRGISLPHFLMLFSVITISSLAFMQATVSTKRAMVRQLMNLDKQDFKNQMDIVFTDPDMCSCQLNPTTNVDDTNDPTLYFNSTITDGSQSLSVNRLQAGCLLSSPDIVKVGDSASGNSQVDSIQLVNLKPSPTAGQWQGDWKIEFKSNQFVSVNPLIIPQIIALDPTALATTPTNVFVQACVPSPITTASITTGCATGWSMVGPEGEPGTFCIDTNERGAKTRTEAINECAGLDPVAIGPARLCEYREWYYACRTGALQDANNNFEWVVEYAGNINWGAAVGYPNCETGQDDDPTDNKGGNKVSVPIPFRCCYP